MKPFDRGRRHRPSLTHLLGVTLVCIATVAAGTGHTTSADPSGRADGAVGPGVALPALSGAFPPLTGARPASFGARPAQAGICSASALKSVSPRVALLGEEVEVTVDVEASCQSTSPLHLALVLDASGSMAGQGNAWLRAEARALATRLMVGTRRTVRIGAVSFNDAARILCPLTSNTAEIGRCIDRLGASGGTDMGAGISAGRLVLLGGRRDYPDPPPREVLLVATDGENSEGCDRVRPQVEKLNSYGIDLLTLCLGTGCDSRCMRELAGDPHRYFESRDITRLGRTMADIEDALARAPVAAIELAAGVPAALWPVPGSASPPTRSLTLTWRVDTPTRTLTTFTYRLLTLEVGRHVVGTGTVGRAIGPAGHVVPFTAQEPAVLVVAPGPPFPPTTTRTATATNTPVATTTAVASVTPTASWTPGSMATAAAPSTTATTSTPVAQGGLRVLLPRVTR